MNGGYWPWAAGGVGLALVVLAHGLVLGRLLGVSGRVSALVDRVRLGAPPGEDDDMTTEDLLAALRAQASELVPEGEIPAALEPTPALAPRPAGSPRPRPLEHVLFFVGLVLGGALSAALSAAGPPVATLRGPGFAATFGGLGVPALLGGGLLVGFGTRMCGGCTSGHGLCGLARLQPGSALATVSFFGAGIATALVLEAVAP